VVKLKILKFCVLVRPSINFIAIIGVVFDNLDDKNIQYTIRPVHEVSGDDGGSTWNLDDVQPRFQPPGPRVSPK